MSPYTKKNEWDVTLDTLQAVQKKFPVDEKKITKKTVLLGFDGYVDSLYSLVETRASLDAFKIMDSMTQFSTRVANTAGSSCNVERVLKKKIGGGFAPNIGRAMVNLGITINLAASIGYPEVLPLFQEYPPTLKQRMKFLPVGNPGETAGLEFKDGKVMLTDFGNINGLTWDNILQRIGGRDKFIEIIDMADAIGQGHWSLVPKMSDMWERMVAEIFPNVKDSKNKRFYVDPADMTKRSREDIERMTKLLHRVDEFLKATISFNDKEADQASRNLPGFSPIKSEKDLWNAGKQLQSKMDVDSVVIHSPHFATISTSGGHYFVKEGYTSAPKFTTAAGDHFNGGVLFGQLQGNTPAESLVIGNGVTAFFVRTGNSPSIKDTQKFISNYMKYVDADIDSVL